MAVSWGYVDCKWEDSCFLFILVMIHPKVMMTCSKRPQVRLKPWTTAVRTKPPYREQVLYQLSYRAGTPCTHYYVLIYILHIALIFLESGFSNQILDFLTDSREFGLAVISPPLNTGDLQGWAPWRERVSCCARFQTIW